MKDKKEAGTANFLDEHRRLFDFKELSSIAVSEFKTSLSSRELIDQDSISKIFKGDEGNEEN